MDEPEDGSAIAAMLAESRRRLDRVRPEDLERELAEGALVVDIRPVEQRERDGELPGAVVIDRNVLEWRLDPTSPHRRDGADDPGRRIIVVCNEGYSSSLAASTLVRLGLPRATDLIGGFQAWAALRAGASARCSLQEPDMRPAISITSPIIHADSAKEHVRWPRSPGTRRV